MSEEQSARDLLDALQDAVANKNLDAVLELFDEDAVVFGTAAASVGAEEVRGYLTRVLEQEGTVRWEWDHVVPLLSDATVLAFAVVGTVGFDNEAGAAAEDRDPFRLTCVAVRSKGRWRLRHFHGSVPQV
ncbi:SgcJ/EcaC family oxidoreductase [Nocardioides panacisoli]|uniref:SnoaL-like domain-containing protein n=1 Tax=Nocardioides panacisoli TaxID=627624 RepID=A0ABP7J849_9ACTN